MPKVSILLTSYNHEKYLQESIQSILNQSFRDFELYIVDDCSGDSSWDIISSVQDERVIKIRNPKNLGEPVTADFFKGLKGEYYAIAHCDDKWDRLKLEKQVAYLDSHPEIGACFTDVQLIDQNGDAVKDPTHPYYRIFSTSNQSRFEWLRTFFYSGNHLCHPSSLIRTRIRVEENVFVYGLGSLPDFWRWIEICLHHEIYILPEKLTYFRVHYDQSNTSGINPGNTVRLHNEYMLIGEQFYKIPDEDFLQVFPEAEKYVTDGCIDTEYALSRMMIESDHSGFQACGIRHLYDLLNEEASRQRIGRLYGFDGVAFKKLTSTCDMFHCLDEKDYLHMSLYYWTGRDFRAEQVLTKRVYAGYSFVTELDLSDLSFDHLRLDLDEDVSRKFTDLILKLDDEPVDYTIEGWHKRTGNSLLFYTTDPQLHMTVKRKASHLSVSGKTERLSTAEVEEYLNSKPASVIYRIAKKILNKIWRRAK